MRAIAQKIFVSVERNQASYFETRVQSRAPSGLAVGGLLGSWLWRV